jgi:hypothetical protein
MTVDNLGTHVFTDHGALCMILVAGVDFTYGKGKRKTTTEAAEPENYSDYGIM